MAEGLARAVAPPGWTVSSAGSAPGRLSSRATSVMAEIGIDISSHHSKGLDDVPMDGADMVVTLCAEEACPVIPPHVEHLDWAMPDPGAVAGSEEAALDAFRKVRDEIRQRVAGLWPG
jgi:protein-tyrosine-phosphatase